MCSFLIKHILRVKICKFCAKLKNQKIEKLRELYGQILEAN